MLAAKVEKQINASRASEDIAAYAGQPDWQQSLIIEKDDASSRSKKKKVKAIVYTPFSKKNERKTAAILQSSISDTDTIFHMLYPQHYLQYRFGAHSDTAWNAYDLFNIFASFDYSLYGTSQYIVNDGRIFGKNEKDTLLVTRQSGAVSNIANRRVGSSGSKLQSISICTTWTSCVYGTDGATGSSSCKTTETCTSYWIEIGDGGGGSTTPGTTAGGGGTAGTPSNDPNINGSPCPTPTVARYNERAPEVSPCPQPWESTAVPVDCASFVFLKTSTADWQEAGLNNIRLRWAWTKSGIMREVYIQHLVFGLPTKYGNNKILTPGAAASVAAQAVDAAKILTYLAFDDSPTYPTDYQVTEYFKKQLNIFMISQGGTVGATGSGSSSIIFKNEIRTGGFFNDPYDCK